MNVLELAGQQRQFLELLCQGEKRGNIIKYSMIHNRVAKTVSSNRVTPLVAVEKADNVYVTINTFSGNKRKSSKLFAINGIYIDIDGHDLDVENIEFAKNNTRRIINKAIADGILCDYTAMIDSGRGLGLLFLYDRSISAHGNTEKQIKFHKSIYVKMIRLITEILDSCQDLTLSVDTSVKDVARLCGLPGTYNGKAGTYRKIVKINPDKRYSLSQISDICGFTYSKKNKKNAKKYVKTVSELGKSRAEKLVKLRDSRTDWTGMHHQLCFIYYNTVKLFMDKDDVAYALERFNAEFADYSISSNEIRSIIASSHSYTKTYSFSNAYIINTLNLSEQEAVDLMFESKESREEKKRQTLTKRLDRDKIVVVAILQCDTYDEVSYRTGVSLRTIKRIAKKYDCGHTNGSIKRLEDVNWDMFTVDQFILNEKSARNCHMDVYPNNNTANKSIETDETVTENDFAVEGINFDITEEDDATDNFVTDVIYQIVNEEKHSYGLSFLQYLRNNISSEELKNIVILMQDQLYHMTDKDLLEQTLSALDYLASEYTYDPEFSAAIYDMEHLIKAINNGHFSFVLHGFTHAVPANKIYPDTYKKIDGIDEMFDKLQEDFAQCKVKSIMDNVENVRKWFKTILTNKGWNECIINGVTVFRNDLIKAMRKLDIYDMCAVINTVGKVKGFKWHKELYVKDNFVEYRELFWKQCAAKGYI